MSVARDRLSPGFRPMQEADLAVVLEIERAAYSFPWTKGIFLDCLRVGYNCWVVSIGDMVCGYGIMSLVAGESHILNICIKPEIQGRGIGRELLLHLLDLSKEYGACIALLEVRPSNGVAVRMYETMGFSEVGRRKAYYPGDASREDALIFALDL
ncbi:MAG: ribosomal protein S18-alanine N-acetyltransferase [Gammaproteobacteria bacterium]